MDRLNLDLHIEELILQGFPGCDRDRMGSVITQELTRLFIEQGIPRSFQQSHQQPGNPQQSNPSLRLPDGSFEVTTGSRIEVAGAEIAQKIYGGFHNT